MKIISKGKYQRANIKNILALGVAILCAVRCALPAAARIGLVTVPKRDAVALTIYNAADLTLVRETRRLTLTKGKNMLEFSWAGTLIDPTSIQFDAKTQGDKVDLIDISFPAHTPNALVWYLNSDYEGEVLVEISYFTSGLTWSADYEGLVDTSGKTMKIASFVKVTNTSGEDYDGASVRLVVGIIHLVENIADLATRRAGELREDVAVAAREAFDKMDERSLGQNQAALSGGIYGDGDEDSAGSEEEAPPEIIREGLSEYFLYTVSGIHSVPDQWSVRWPNFSKADVDIEDFYRYEEDVYDQPQRFVRLRNDKPHHLGEEPLPDGAVLVYQARQNAGAGQARLGSSGTRFFLGRSLSKYIPIGESWEIDLGEDPDVIVTPTLVRWSVTETDFDSDGDISGWDVKEEWKLEILNSRTKPMSIEIDRNFDDDFTFESNAKYEKYDVDTIRFKRTLAPQAREEIAYSVTTRNGSRARR